MNKKNIFIYLLMALPLMLTSCLKDQEDVFSDSASARSAKYLDNVRKVLASSENGWVLNYYPDRELSYGGYVYTLKFDQENVEVFSELASDDAPSKTSSYILNNENGPVLMFDTYNEYMHFFATPHGSSGAGGYEAYDGDFLFIVMNISDDQNTITLKGSRSGNMMYMHRLTGEETAATYISKIKAVKQNMKYKKFEIVFGNDTVNVSYARSIQKSGGKFTFNYKENGAEQTVSTPVILGLDGFMFKDTINVLGHEILGLKHVPGAEENIPAVNDPSILFNPIIPPLSQQFLDGVWFIAYSQLGAYAQRYYDAVQEALTGIGEKLYYAYLANEEGGFGLQFGSYDGKSLYSGSLFFDTAVISDDEVALKFAMKGAGDGVWYHNNANFHYALWPFGYRSANTFKLTTDNLAEPSYITLTDKAQPANVITLTADEVIWPFEK